MIIKKTLTILLAVMIIASFSLIPAFGESIFEYDGQKTAQFAKDNFVRNGDNNWTHDCVVFARLCLEAGGVPRDSSTRSYSSGGYGSYLVKNGYAEKFVLHTDKKGRVTVDGNEGKISAGDLLVNYCNNPKCPKPAFHSSVVYTTEGGYWMQYHHSRSGHPGYGYCQTYSCSKCRCKDTKVLVYHIKSGGNGYGPYTDAVTGVEANQSSYNKIEVSWDDLDSANKGYNVYCMYSDQNQFNLIGSVDSNTTEYDYVVKNPDRYGQDMQLFVVPVRTDRDGEEETEEGAVSDVMNTHTAPELPSNVKGERLSDNTVRLTWDEGKGGDGCKIEYRYKGDDDWNTSGTTSKSSYNLIVKKSMRDIEVRIVPFVEGKDGIRYNDEGKEVSVE